MFRFSKYSYCNVQNRLVMENVPLNLPIASMPFSMLPENSFLMDSSISLPVMASNSAKICFKIGFKYFKV